LSLNIEPLALSIGSSGKKSLLLLKLAPQDIPRTLAFVESTWKKFYPDRVFRYSFLDETLDRMYGRERKLGTMFLSFTLLAMLIAGLGLFGIASFTAEQKTREIGIRKVLGASVSGISFLLTGNFLRLVFSAAIMACPLGWFIMHTWLQNFAYRTRISPLVFAASIFLSFGLAILAVSWQTLKAASADPVNSLRYE
jgi:putative ABC transport system permease protein